MPGKVPPKKHAAKAGANKSGKPSQVFILTFRVMAVDAAKPGKENFEYCTGAPEKTITPPSRG
jgi:hypothetical protein